MSELPYTILLERDPEDGSHTVTVPAPPGIVTQGANLQEAIAMARDAIRLHIESLVADGEPVPQEQAAPQLITITVDTAAA